jgi:uncharacterized protein (DUF885 family)
MRAALCVCLSAVCATAQSPTKPQCPCAQPHTKPSPADLAFRAIYTADETWRQSQPGHTTPEDEQRHLGPTHLPHVDPATQTAEQQHWQDILHQLDAIDQKSLSPADHLNFEIYKAQITVLYNQQKFHEYERPANSDSAFWSDLTESNRDGFRSLEAAQRALSRLHDIPRYFDEQTANMRAGLARNFTPPRVTLEGRDTSIRSIAEAKSPQDTAFYKPFEKLPANTPPGEAAKLQTAAADAIATEVIPAYKKLLAFFDGEYVPHAQPSLAAEDLPDGKAYYQSLILEYTTTTLSPQQIHEIGLKEMAGIRAEMLETIKLSGSTANVADFLHFLRTDPQFYAKTPDELLLRAAGIAKEFDAVSGKYFGYLPRQRFAIRPVPNDIAPFYTSARGGAGVYLVNTYDLPARPLYSLPALTLHESAPGHAFQIPIATETSREQHWPHFRNAYISAYGEGWALYCERLGTEMGIYHTPYETFGMLSYQAWRAARLVVDTGVHSMGWTRDQARAYLRDNTALSEQEINTEVDRYISWPGQALSYYLGEMAIQKARHKAETTLGPKFNIRAFHDEVLSLGSVPLPVLEEQVDNWIAHGGTGPYPEMEQ